MPYSHPSGWMGSRSYRGHSSISAETGTSPTTLPSLITRIRSVPVTSPTIAAPVCQRSQVASSSSMLPGSTTASILSCDSEIMISNGSMPASRSGTRPTSTSIPTPPAEAISAVEELRPAAPRS